MDSDGADYMSVDSRSMEDHSAPFSQPLSRKDKTQGKGKADNKAARVGPYEAQNRDQMSQHPKNTLVKKIRYKKSHSKPDDQAQVESAEYPAKERSMNMIPQSSNQMLSNPASREGVRKSIAGQDEGSLSHSQHQLGGSVSTRTARDELSADEPTRRTVGSVYQEQQGYQDVGLGAPCHNSAQPIFIQQDNGSLSRALTEKCRNLESERDRLKTQNEHLQEQQAIIERRYTSLQSESMTHQYQEMDSHMKNQFKALVNGIKTWVLKRVPSSSLSCKLEANDDTVRYLEAIAPQTKGINELLNLFHRDRKVRMYLLRGLICRILLDSVFDGTEHDRLESGQDSPHPWLPSEVGKSLKVLMRELQNRGHAPEVFHRWRSMTMALLGPAPTDTHSHHASASQLLQAFTENEADRIFGIIAPLIGDEAEQNEEFISKAKSDLKNSVKKAVELSLLICHQRASWELRFPSQEVDFDPRGMQAIGVLDHDHAPGEPPKKTIEILISPALCKQGSMDGEDYGNLFVVEKAEVWTS